MNENSNRRLNQDRRKSFNKNYFFSGGKDRRSGKERGGVLSLTSLIAATTHWFLLFKNWFSSNLSVMESACIYLLFMKAFCTSLKLWYSHGICIIWKVDIMGRNLQHSFCVPQAFYSLWIFSLNHPLKLLYSSTFNFYIDMKILIRLRIKYILILIPASIYVWSIPASGFSITSINCAI